jgi:hypothetical protein
MSTKSPERLEELILYVADKMVTDHHAGVGRIKLAKLLWRIDFTGYWKLGHSISGATYQADKFGPSPVEELLATRDLESRGRFSWEQDWDRRWMPVVSDHKPRMQLFTEDERHIIDSTLDRFRNTSGKQMVDEAHEFPGWIHAWRNGEGQGSPIPYEAVFWDRSRELTPDQERHARELAREFSHLLD